MRKNKGMGVPPFHGMNPKSVEYIRLAMEELEYQWKTWDRFIANSGVLIGGNAYDEMFNSRKSAKLAADNLRNEVLYGLLDDEPEEEDTEDERESALTPAERNK